MNRWIVEARNGHLQSIFKFFGKIINMQHAQNLNSFYLIAGALLNKYHPLIQMQNATEEKARDILRKSQIPNNVQRRVEEGNLTRRNGQWRRLNYRDIPDFPILDLDYLRNLTIGTYQVNLAPSYVQDKILHEEDEEFQLDENINDEGFLRIRVKSRFRNATKHQVFISYRIIHDGNNNENDEEGAAEDVISGYYCTCQCGARTVGTCSHVTSVLWFLGYARHQRNIKYPDSSLLNVTLDAANRLPQDGNVEILDV